MPFTVTTDDEAQQETASRLQEALNQDPSKLQQAERYAQGVSQIEQLRQQAREQAQTVGGGFGRLSDYQAFQQQQSLASILQHQQYQQQFAEQLQQSREQEQRRAKLSTAMQFLQSFTYGRAASRMTGSEFDTSGDELQETADVAARIVRRYLESED